MLLFLLSSQNVLHWKGEQYVNEHRDEIEALRIIYNNNGEPITYAMLKDFGKQIYRRK